MKEIPESIKRMIKAEPIAFIRLALALQDPIVQMAFDDLVNDYDRLKRENEELNLALTERIQQELDFLKGLYL